MHINCRYLELLNACIFKSVYVLLNVRNGKKFKYPSIVFLSIYCIRLPNHSAGSYTDYFMAKLLFYYMLSEVEALSSENMCTKYRL